MNLGRFRKSTKCILFRWAASRKRRRADPRLPANVWPFDWNVDFFSVFSASLAVFSSIFTQTLLSMLDFPLNTVRPLKQHISIHSANDSLAIQDKRSQVSHQSSPSLFKLSISRVFNLNINFNLITSASFTFIRCDK